jgi:two-component system response regulator RegA
MSAAALDVLVVEDDEAVLALLTRTLCDAGYRVGVAASFDEGRRALKEGSPRVLITDIRLGAYNGLQLVALVSATQQQTRTLVLTGFPDPVLEAEAKRLGARYALKPLAPGALLAAVAELLCDF